MERLSEFERRELWDRWEAGESQRSIARALGRAPATVRTRLLSSGWRRPVPPAEWCSLRLSLGEREEISRGIARGESLRSIAERLGRSSSTVSREVKINGGCDRYRAVIAHQASRKRAKRPNAMKLETCPRLRSVVEDKLELWWSPSQISRWLVRAYPDDQEMRDNTKRSTNPCLSKAEARYVPSCGVPCAPGVQCAGLRDEQHRPRARSVTWS